MNWNFGLAALLPFVALAFQWLLWPWLSPYAWLLFYPSVFFSARLDGIRGGLTSTFLSIAIVWYCFPPQFGWAIDNPKHFYPMAIFLLMGYLLSDTHECLRRSKAKIKADIIKETEARFVATFEQAAVGIAMLSPDGRWLKVNQKLCDIVGYPHDELLAKTFQDITYPDDLETDLAYVRQLLAGEIKSYTMEKRYLRKDGSYTWTNLTVALVRKADGSPDYFISVVEDIQQRKRIEATLKKRNDELAEAQHVAHIGSWLYDFSGLISCSDEIYRLYEIDKASFVLTEKAFINLLHPDDRRAMETWIQACVAGQQPDGLVFRRPLKDGSLRYFIARGELKRDEDHKPLYLSGTVQDITILKLAELSLRESEEIFRCAFANAAIGFAITNIKGFFINANPSYCKITGYTLDELRNMTFAQLIHPDDLQKNMALVGHLLANETEGFVFENRYCQKSGNLVWARKSVSLVRKQTGEPEWLIALVEDITERKQAEAEIRLLNANLEQRVSERTAELSTAVKEMDSFAYAVSHDLRAPLRAISGFSQALQEDFGGQFPDEAKLYLDQINIASNKMGELIDGLLTLSRSTRGELQIERVDLSALATQLLAEFKLTDPERQVAIDVETGLQLSGDGRMIAVLMQNLLDNAWKYTQKTDHPSIRFYAEERDGKRYFCVADNGAGFDMAHANRLFQAFQRLHRQDEFPGIGIGLATVQRIIHRHGGTIEARGEIGKGAVFSFTLG